MSGHPPTGPTPTEESLLAKYGLPVVPVVAAFGTTFAVDLVKKTIIKKVLDPGEEAGTAPATNTEVGGAILKLQHYIIIPRVTKYMLSPFAL